ncbi:hypothetical protein COZ63_00275 [Candidatus Berkelbacteria bacterium CG_4_8_14_3_um_filter_42_13]|uniref:Uncharacterized protein n=1 Tax=Candidatus Berkelbacteria bacterium CG_4_8_14_3_um_filter_42_13 TaxID=1974505 RepID=A0A2M7K2C3_9BACT|nr:MAG: hypothetical protein COZ63_00275 [Candidatus Berkelbacteria bacterium CG_4_8_14_3_um_filter_42_13]
MSKTVWIVLAVLLVVAAGVYELSSVEVWTGTLVICTADNHHGGRKVRSDVHPLSVPRWKSKRYGVTEKKIVCDQCKARAEQDRREAERQAELKRKEEERKARISELMTSISGGMSFGSGTGFSEGKASDFTVSIAPGGYIPLELIVLNLSDKPMSGLKVRIEHGDILRADLPTSMPNSPDIEQLYRKRRWEFRLLTTSGLPLGRVVNPAKNAYYSPDGWSWPSGAPPTDPDWYKSCSYSYLSRSAKSGSDITMTMFVIYQGVEISLNSAQIRVKYQ